MFLRVRFLRSGVNDNEFRRVVLQIHIDIGGVRLESQLGWKWSSAALGSSGGMAITFEGWGLGLSDFGISAHLYQQSRVVSAKIFMVQIANTAIADSSSRSRVMP